MALGKDNISGTTNYYDSLLRSLKNACTDAADRVNECKLSVDANWEGESGTAMSDALYRLKCDINALCSEISDLQYRVRARGSSITSNWAEESEP